MNRW